MKAYTYLLLNLVIASAGIAQPVSNSSTPGGQLLATASIISKEETDIFKEQLLTILADSAKQFSSIAAAPYLDEQEKHRSVVCLPGAVECYVKGNTKTFYADFGKFTDEKLAAQKYHMLREKLHHTVGDANWNSTETSKAGYIDKYILTRRKAEPHPTGITTYIERANGSYHLYMTIK